MNFTAWQWAILALGAFSTGLAKTGISGLGILSVALFANVLPARESTGALLPLLLCADVIGVAIFRKHASWPHLVKLFPWVLVGVVAGSFALGRISNLQVQQMIGVILLVMTALYLWREKSAPESADNFPHRWWFVAFTGVLAGFTTMVANAAGPVMVLYLLAVELPKLAFIGTWAWFFLLVNVSKVPFSLHLGLITFDSLKLDAILLLAMIPGTILGPQLLKHINQLLFERLALALTLVAALRLLWR